MNNLSIARQNAHITQTELAKQLGVAKNTVSQWECGKREPDIQTLIRIADIYNVTLDYLCDHEIKNMLDLTSIPNQLVKIIEVAKNFDRIKLANLQGYALRLAQEN